jgi:hypothetical protein
MTLVDEQRSRETRARAELALVRLLHALGDEDIFLVVLGGLVPEVLASNEALVPQHLGTTGTADSGSVGYAKQALEVQPEVGEAELRADAVDVVQRFFAELARR